jgi:hypothetical protein
MSSKAGSSCRKSGTDYHWPHSTVDIERRQFWNIPELHGQEEEAEFECTQLEETFREEASEMPVIQVDLGHWEFGAAFFCSRQAIP